ncbi:P2X purinoceptor 7-like [Saccostrea cucullata]|uniref:P2X purinoceptor 7-like n=1 Tax=Saccostrea cuccullata TaxID=36930 RepID=UPI002ED4BA65
METLEGDIPSVDFSQSIDVRPYQFEPLADTSDSMQSTGSEEKNSDIEEFPNRLVNTDWCECGFCISMPTVDECICCKEIGAVQAETVTGDHQCITESPIFTANCLNRHVLYVSMYEYLQNVGPLDDNQPPHEIYRYLAYRRFVRWIWHFLGKKHRKILPACVVTKIREAFPSEHYCGFKYAM